MFVVCCVAVLAQQTFGGVDQEIPSASFSDALARFHLSNGGKTVRRLPVEVLPENVFWWFTTRDFADGMKTFNRLVDEGFEKSTYNCVTLSLRCNPEFGDSETQSAAMKFFKKARAAGVKAYMDTDPRIARREFLSRWPKELQGVATVVMVASTNGYANISYEFKDVEDHMTSGAKVSYRPLAARVSSAFVVALNADGTPDLARRRSVNVRQDVSVKEWQVADDDEYGNMERSSAAINVSASGLADGEALIVVLTADYHCIDVFSPHLIPYARELMARCKNLGADGGMRDEWGFMPDYLPDLRTFWWSSNLAEAYRKVSKRSLLDDYPLMALGANGDPRRSKAIGAFMKLILDRNVEIELDFYDTDKRLFGKDVYVVKHPTWHCWICPQEYFHNGLDWWQAKRDWAQGDEVTPFYVLTALTKKWDSPIWLNEGYSATSEKNTFRVWTYAMCGGRQVYHCLYSGKPEEMEKYSRMPWEERRVRLSLDLLDADCVVAQSRVRLPNLISRAPVDSPVAFIFGHERLVDWSGDGWNDHGKNVLLDLAADGWWCDAYPGSECMGGTFFVDADGYLRVGRQKYRAVMLHQLSASERVAFDAVVKGRPLKTLIFGSNESKEMHRYLVSSGVVRQPCAKGKTPAGAVYPEPDGTLRLLDGTAIRIRAGWDSPRGLPIAEGMESNGVKVSGEAEGIAAVLCENREVTAFAGGGVTHVEGAGLSLSLERPEDVALLKIGGRWCGVWQTADATAQIPSPLAALTGHWVRLLLPEHLKCK